jgi:imidazolonepropionase-like amidohydrolase
MKRFTFTIFLLSLITSVSAQQTYPVNGTTDPRHIEYAFINARLHQDYKTTIDSATLIVKDGIITASGNGLAIPAGAVIFNLKGKHIYPSFIDIFSDYGLPEVKKAQDQEAPQLLSNTKGAFGWNQAVKPEYDAYKVFAADNKKADELRKSGFGTVMTIYRDGIIRGTSSLVLLGDGKENDLILRSRAAANFSFDKGSSTQDYPSSLMGAIALIRQTYLDAKWYLDGGYRKEYNISLDGFNSSKNLPIVFEAGDKQNILRASKLGKEFGADYIIKGNGDEYERIIEIKAAGNALIVPLNFPDAFDVSDPYDAMNISLREMKQWELAPANAATLASHQIPFALTASDLKNKNDFLKQLRKAIEFGLREEDALKALTHTPAQILGFGDSLGQLRKNSIANFIITSKNFTDKDNIIFENWIKGIRYKYADEGTGDLRGNYSLRINNLAPVKLKISGDANSPEAFITEDTSTSSKAVFSRQMNLVSIQYELKKTNAGIYRLTGVIDENTPTKWSGNVLLPTGEWGKWTATFDSLNAPTVVKADSIKKDTTRGPVLFPNMAYGFKELPAASSFVIRHATVWTSEAEGIIQDADVYVANGKVQQVGKSISVPSGTKEIDGNGKHLTSGVIDEHSHIAISGSVNEATQASSAEVRIGDVLDADDIQIYRQLAGGVTSSHLLHGSANPIGGQTQLIKLRWGHSPEELKFKNWSGFIKFALGENVKQSHWGDKQVVRFPQTRMGTEQVYVDYFTRAKEYENQLKTFANSKIKPKDPVRRDLELDALVEIMNSKRFITCHSYVQSEINMLMHVADTFGFKINTFTHILEGYKVADKMKKHGVSGVSSFSDWWAYKYEVYEAIPYNGAIMHRMGLNVSFNSDDPEMARRLNQEAAKAVKYGGVSEAEAWKFVTLNPAKMLHVDDQVGSIKAGKDADLVLWNENPLSIYAKPLQTYVDGIKYFDVETDAQLQRDIRNERLRLMKKMADAKSRGENVQKHGLKASVIKHCEEEENIYFK